MLQFPWIGLGQPPESKAIENSSSSSSTPLERPRRVVAAVSRTDPQPLEQRVRDTAGAQQRTVTTQSSSPQPSPETPSMETQGDASPPADEGDTSEPPPSPAPSGSGDKAAKDSAAASAKSTSTGGKSGGKRKIVLDEDLLIEGKLEKPSAFFILRRSAAQHDWARLQVQFSPLVYESVQDPLF